MKGESKAGFLISGIHRSSNRIFNQLLRNYGIEINSAQGRILFVLWEQDGISISELSVKTDLKKSTLTSMLDRLEKQGFIRREASASDRRSILIRRTEKDRELQAKYDSVSREMIDICYKGFSREEFDLFEALLERMKSNLEAEELQD